MKSDVSGLDSRLWFAKRKCVALNIILKHLLFRVFEYKNTAKYILLLRTSLSDCFCPKDGLAYIRNFIPPPWKPLSLSSSNSLLQALICSLQQSLHCSVPAGQQQELAVAWACNAVKGGQSCLSIAINLRVYAQLPSSTCPADTK